MKIINEYYVKMSYQDYKNKVICKEVNQEIKDIQTCPLNICEGYCMPSSCNRSEQFPKENNNDSSKSKNKG